MFKQEPLQEKQFRHPKSEENSWTVSIAGSLWSGNKSRGASTEGSSAKLRLRSNEKVGHVGSKLGSFVLFRYPAAPPHKELLLLEGDLTLLHCSDVKSPWLLVD